MQIKQTNIWVRIKYYCWVVCRMTHSICDTFLLKIIIQLIPRRYRLIKLTNILVLLFFLTVFIQIVIYGNIKYYRKLTTPTPPIAILHKPVLEKVYGNKVDKNNSAVLKIPSEIEFRMSWVKNKLEKLANYSQRLEILNVISGVTPLPKPTTKVHIFYYTTYGNPEMDGDWKMWNEVDVSNKSIAESKLNLKRRHSPPEDIASSFYPLLGCYSSRDPQIIDSHFKQIHDLGIGVVVVSWLPPKPPDTTDDIFNNILNSAEKYDLKATVHIEAYVGRTPDNLFRNIHYLTTKFTFHPAFYKLKKNGKHLPVYYVSEPYLTPVPAWRELLTKDGSQTVRGTPYDGIFIALLLEKHHKHDIERSQFDGFYTYFASNGYSYGSSWKNWKALGNFAKKQKLLFFPSVSPGYIDTRVRPWNSVLTRHRSRGHYYQVAWRTAIAAQPYGVSVISFNQWSEGTQIEAAKPKVTRQFTYLDYEPEGGLFYLNLTRYWVKQFVTNRVR